MGELTTPHPKPGTRDAHALLRVTASLVFTFLLMALLITGLITLLPLIAGPEVPVLPIVIGACIPIALTLLGAVVERILPPAGPRKSWERWILHLQLTIFWFLIFTLVNVAILTAASAAARAFDLKLGLIDLRMEDGAGWLKLIGYTWIVAIIGDLFYYWYHRAMHSSPALWQIHKLHHMDPELDATTWSRTNWIDAFFSSALIILPFTIVFRVDSLDPWELGTVGLIITGVKFLLTAGHANVRVQVGWASIFWCTPQVHRIHHSRLPEHHDKNFAFTFPLWDVMFGTYHPPKRDEFPPTGVHGEAEIASFWEAQTFGPRELIKLVRQRRQEKRIGMMPVAAE